ncbi:MAG: hypothetical protein IT328_12665 [Caldilineaceae bacterium]|nr:hypothetical protein [Caldilineaceae bacterium]
MSSLVHRQPHAQRVQGPSFTSTPDRLIGGVRFEWAMSLLGLIFLGGLYLDGWAHNHDKTDQSFFTICHAFFYSGFLLIVLLLVTTLWINHRRGIAWNQALPAGYSLSMFGVLLFAVGGVGDMLWHELFGVEADFDALFSPSHLVLALGMALINTGPLRAAWARPGKRLSWTDGGPALLSLTTLVSGLSFLLMASHPLVSTIAGAAHDDGSRFVEIAGVSGVLLTTLFTMGPILLAIRRWRLPAGSLILILGIDTFAMAIVNWHHDYTLWLMLAMFVAVLLVEVVRLRLEPLMEKKNALRVFAALAPFLLMGSYFIALLFTEGTHWSIHLWTGTIVEASLAGWLLSYLVVPPAVPAEVTQ